MQGGTNLEQVRDYNQSVVLEAIRLSRGISRVEIADQSGLTAQTVSNIVKRLIGQGIVVEAGRADSLGGKPRVKLRLNPDGAYALGAHLDRDHVMLVLTDLNGEVLHQIQYPTNQAQGPHAIIAQIAQSAQAMVERAKINPEKVLGLGVACPGPLNQHTGVVYDPPNFSGWREIPLRALLRQHLEFPVMIDHDAMAAAIGERWSGGARGRRNFAFIYLGAGVGAGLVLDHRVYRGSTTCAGEFGHMMIDINGPACSCGSSGCVERYCAPQDIVATVERRLGSPPGDRVPSALQAALTAGPLTFGQIAAAARGGDALARTAIAESATMLALGVTNLVNLLDLELVLLGGPTIQGLEPIYQDVVQRVVNERMMARDWRRVEIALSTAQERAVPVGAAALVLHELYAPHLAGLRTSQRTLETGAISGLG